MRPVTSGERQVKSETRNSKLEIPEGASGRSGPGFTNWHVLQAGGLQILQAGTLEKLPWLVHGFSTRSGGASTLDGQRVLNLGTVEWDTPGNVAANRRQLLAALGASGATLVTLRQIHSDLAHAVSAAPRGLLKGDAAITQTPGLALAVQTADCIPILLADTRRQAIAAVHAGWRGTLARIAAKTIGQMQMQFGTRPKDVVAALGPGIVRCCYEVGIEVVQKFHAQFANARGWFEGPYERLMADDSPNPLQWLSMAPPGHPPPPPAAHLDLHAANRWQLEDAGVPARNISASDLCSACRMDLLFSHRRERGRTGRMMGVIALRP